VSRALWLVLVLTGCAEALPVDATCAAPADIRVHLASGALLNPDEQGQPLPTEVRVLELRDAASFESLSFEDAWTPAPAIEAAIVSTRSVTLYPGETSELAVQPSPDTRALVGIAIVRRPAGRTWRVIVPVEAVPCGSSAALAWLVDEYRIERASEER